MVNCSNVTAGFKAAGNYITNNPKKVAAAVVTAGLVAAGVYFRAELATQSALAYEKTAEFANTTLAQVKEAATPASDSLYKSTVIFLRKTFDSTSGLGQFIQNNLIDFREACGLTPTCTISPKDVLPSSVWYDDFQAASGRNCTL
jgi:hypothetical protein